MNLTEEQRKWLLRYKSRGPGVLRIIDALTEALAAAELTARNTLDTSASLAQAFEAAEARVRELAAAQQWSAQATAANQTLLVSAEAAEARVRELEADITSLTADYSDLLIRNGEAETGLAQLRARVAKADAILDAHGHDGCLAALEALRG